MLMFQKLLVQTVYYQIIGAVLSGYTLFVSILEMINNDNIYLQPSTSADAIFQMNVLFALAFIHL